MANSEDALHQYAARLLTGGSTRQDDAALMERLAAEVRELRRVRDHLSCPETGSACDRMCMTMCHRRSEMITELRRDRDEEHDRRLNWRGIDPGDECSACGGAGSRAYGSTATWRGGIGGQVITIDVCNRCWGSGSKTHRWPSHRAAMGGGEGEP